MPEVIKKIPFLFVPGSDCCKRWAYVRDYYIRRKVKPGTGSGGEASKKRSDLLSFLDNMPSLQRNTFSNVVGDELPQDQCDITEDTPADIKENFTQINETRNMKEIYKEDNNESDNYKGDSRKNVKKKIKLTHSEERLQLPQLTQPKETPAQNELDETDLFFNSIAKIVKKLSRYEQVQLRMQISSLVGNAELRSISNESRQTNPGSKPSTSYPETMISPTTKNEPLNDEGQIYYVSDTS